jgi:plasmid stability protein
MVIRNIPDDVLRRFKERARAESKSAEQLAREVIAEKARPAREDLLRDMEAIKAQASPLDSTTMLRIMREAREERDARPYRGPVDE